MNKKKKGFVTLWNSLLKSLVPSKPKAALAWTQLKFFSSGTSITSSKKGLWSTTKIVEEVLEMGCKKQTDLLFSFSSSKTLVGGTENTWWTAVLSAKLDDLSWLPETHMTEINSSKLSSGFHRCTIAHTHHPLNK